jgi:queuine tRNA-ribosyltransferase
MFEIINQDGKARIGKLHTKKGIGETPFFMPVSTKMTPKHINSMQLNKSVRKPMILLNLILVIL